MNGADPLYLFYVNLATAFVAVFLLPKIVRSSGWFVGFFACLGLVLAWLALSVASSGVQGSLPWRFHAALGVAAAVMLCFRITLWLATRDPYEWEANRRALNGPVGGGNADSEGRLNAPAMLLDRKNNRFVFVNWLNSFGQYRAMQPGEGWRGVVARLLL